MTHAAGSLTLTFVVIVAGLMVPRSVTCANDSELFGTEYQILVTMRQTATANKSVARRKPYQRSYGKGPSVATKNKLNRIARDYSIERLDGWLIRSLGVYCEVFSVPAHLSVEAVIERLNRDKRVQRAQPMNLFRTMTHPYNDPYFSMQSAALQLQISRAHGWSTGHQVTIAIVDSAVDKTHPELVDRISSSHNFVSKNESNGEIHGTAVAGIIASAVNNGQGIVGVAPDAKLVVLRACWQEQDDVQSAYCSTFTLARALEAALELQPDVLNMSLAGPEDPLLHELLQKALAGGMIVVTADAGSIMHQSSFPASVPGIIAAQVPNENHLSDATHAVHAPGNQIITTVPENGYAILSGNSLAAAHVSGVIALLLQHQRNLNTTELMNYLTDSTSHGSSSSINACRALTLLLSAEGCDVQIASL